MKWNKVSNRRWEAVGKTGMFIIEQSGKLFWSRYVSVVGKAFKLVPTQKLRDAKAMCQDNYYWEGV